MAKSDDRNHATRRRQERQEQLRDYLAERARLSYILDNIEKMENEGGDMPAQGLTALKYANDQRLKLLDKYLPSLQNVEATGEGGGDLIIKITKNFD